MEIADYAKIIKNLTKEELVELDRLLAMSIWTPLPGPQTDAYYCEADELFYGGAAGGGKGLLPTEKIATPFGYRCVGDLSVGDRVLAASGCMSRVIGVFNRGCQPLYRVSFSDGGKIVTDGDHLWNYSIARKGRWHKSGLEWKVGTTAGLSSLMETGSRVLIPVCSPLKFNKTYRYDMRPVDPYVLGLLLGDGYTAQSGPGAKWSFSTMDNKLLSALPGEWVSEGWCDYRVRGESRVVLQGAFKRLGLDGCRSSDKFIPEPYLWGTIEDRISLLQGLMDTDGTVTCDGKAYFTSTSKALSDQVRWLCLSLGGRGTVTSRVPVCTNGANGRVYGARAYTVCIRMPDNRILFRLKRKRDLAGEYNGGGKTLKRRIESIEPCGAGRTVCIAIDDPSSLYVAGDDLIVTHNTDLILGLSLTAHKKSIIFRRNGTELTGILDRLHGEILGNKDGFNGKDNIQRLPKGRQIEFGACPNVGDERKYQGRPHDLKCVERGTKILLPCGGYSKIEDLRVGDMVMTLEGQKPVEHIYDIGFDRAVSVTYHPENFPRVQQVQGFDHSILTSGGWVSHDNVNGTHLFSAFSRQPTSLPCAYNTGLLTRILRRAFLQLFLRRCLGRWRTLKSFLLFHRLSPPGIFFSESSKYQGTGCVLFGHQPLKVLQRLLENAHPWHLEPVFCPASQDMTALPFRRAASCVRGETSQIGCLDHCLCESRQCGERVPPISVDGLLYLPQLNGVGPQIPTGSGGDALGSFHKHILHRRSYLHPYTKETRSTDTFFASSPLEFTPVGQRHLFDITVKDANHYISYNGIVNKNCFDEITNFMPSQYNFLRGWLRTRDKNQRTRIVAAGNPPVSSDGEWVIERWGPWLDPDHACPAGDGELRWYATIDGIDTAVESREPIEHLGETIIPKSRTFIKSSVEDNPFLMESGYKSQLQSLPEPLRSQLLKGDFKAGIGDDPWQVLPTSWVREAQARWSAELKSGPMDSIGVDPARGGTDETVISRRHGRWFDELLTYPGKATPDGPAVASLIVSVMRDAAPIHVDIIGIGSSVYDHLKGNNIHVIGVNNAEGTDEVDMTGRLAFRNVRAWSYWMLREALDPKNDQNICLPHDPKLRADLCAPRWELTAGGVLVESKEKIKKRIGRSTDRGDAVVLANMKTRKYLGMYQPNRRKRLRVIK